MAKRLKINSLKLTTDGERNILPALVNGRGVYITSEEELTLSPEAFGLAFIIPAMSYGAAVDVGGDI